MDGSGSVPNKANYIAVPEKAIASTFWVEKGKVSIDYFKSGKVLDL